MGVLDGSYTSITLNVSLCILINSRTNHLTLVINLVSPSYLPKNTCKELRVIYQCDVSWAHHYDSILSKAYKTLTRPTKTHIFRITFSTDKQKAVCFTGPFANDLLQPTLAPHSHQGHK